MLPVCAMQAGEAGEAAQAGEAGEPPPAAAAAATCEQPPLRRGRSHVAAAGARPAATRNARPTARVAATTPEQQHASTPAATTAATAAEDISHAVAAAAAAADTKQPHLLQAPRSRRALQASSKPPAVQSLEACLLHRHVVTCRGHAGGQARKGPAAQPQLSPTQVPLASANGSAHPEVVSAGPACVLVGKKAHHMCFLFLSAGHLSAS